MKKIFVFIYMFLGIISSLFAQYDNMSFESLSIKEGLSQIVVRTVIQDSKGFLWISTQDGLNRYDGRKFVIYRPDFEKPESSINSTNPTFIEEDYESNIFVGTASGLSKYNRKEDRFYNYKHNPDDENTISKGFVVFICEDSYKNLWIINQTGFNKIIFDENNRNIIKKVINYNINPENNEIINPNNISGIVKDKNGDLWFSAFGQGLYKIPKKEQINEIPKAQKFVNSDTSFPSLNINRMKTDKKGNPWFFSGNIITKIDVSDKKPKFINHTINNFVNQGINNFIIDKNENIIFGNGNFGLHIYEIKNEKLHIYTNNPQNPTSLSQNIVLDICEDNTGIIWVGATSGLNKWDPNKSSFINIAPQPNNPDWLRDEFVFALCEDKNNEIWVGTLNGNGIYIYNKKTKKFRNISANPNNPNALQSNFVSVIFRDKTDRLWIGTRGGGLQEYIYETNTFTSYINNPNDPNSISSNFILKIIEDKNNNLWIGTGLGVNKFDKKTEKFTSWSNPNNLDNDTTLSGNNIRGLLFDKNDNLWVGISVNELNVMTFRKNKAPLIKKYKPNLNDSSTINVHSVFNLYDDNKGNIWLATFGGGLNRYSYETKLFNHYTMKDGLPSNVVYEILEAKNGNLWLSTNNGLSELNTKTLEFKNFDVNDGLQSNEFNGGASMIDSEGQIYFGGVNGYNIFTPEKITKNICIPKIVFTDFKIFNKSIIPGENSVLKVSIQEAKEIELDNSHKNLYFEFAALHYTSPKENTFAYKIEGHDDDWINIDTRNYISLTSFPHGKYRLRVKAANSDGIWNEEGISIKLIINPPWWKTNYAYAGALIIIIILIWQFIELRGKKLIKDKRILQEKVKERTQEITLRNNEILEKNEELYQQQEEILAQTEELEVINKKLEKLSIVASETENVVIIMNEKGDFEWVNASFMRFYEYDDLNDYVSVKGKNLTNASENPNIKNLISKCVNEKKSIVYESTFNSKSGKEFFIQTNLTPILDIDKKVKKIVAIDTDISELKEAEKRISKQKEKIEYVHNEMKQSISYAAKIQKAILGDINEVISNFKESFIFLSPHSIVSGDFYWYAQINGYQIMIAADCTGHGVPGAFMTVLGHNYLDEIINKENNFMPDEILYKLDEKVTERLKKQTSAVQVNDGMDLAIITIDKSKNKLYFSGAKNPLIYIRNGEVKRIRGSHFTIGGEKLRRNMKKTFKLHTIDLQKNDTFYIFSDGFKDQIGGKHSRKYLAKRFWNLLLQISEMPINMQKAELKKELLNWRNENEQTDDVLVTGIRI